MRFMAYPHKLSRTLTLLVPIVTVVSCQQPSAAPVVPPPPPPPPPGATILVQETFEDQAFAARGWYDNLALTTTTSQHITGSTRSLEAHFMPGVTTASLGGTARRLVSDRG